MGGIGEGCCPICGCKLVVLDYRGSEPDLLALMRCEGFCCFLGCTRVDLHDKVVEGVDYRGKVFCKSVFHKGSEIMLAREGVSR